MPITLCTNGGNHPPSAYAAGCARTIFDIDPNMSGERAVQAHNLLERIAETLTPAFAGVIEREVAHLATFVDHCDSDYSVLHIAHTVLWQLQALAVGTPWEAKLADAAWALDALNTIASHLATAAHVERLIWADKHPNNQSAVAYKARFHGVG